uniref:AB hydrolase-1 domain-containing protein n=1 Tax=Opuntia streptacantha TaxID=393608 RepID=A0A7C9EBW1_OPUST
MQDKILQQGAYESLHRDLVVLFRSWEFDPLELRNPYSDNSASVHLWIGREDGIVAVEMLRHVAKRLPWIKCHEVPNGGHLLIHDEKLCQIILRSLLLGENPCFE